MLCQPLKLIFNRKVAHRLPQLPYNLLDSPFPALSLKMPPPQPLDYTATVSTRQSSAGSDIGKDTRSLQSSLSPTTSDTSIGSDQQFASDSPLSPLNFNFPSPPGSARGQLVPQQSQGVDVQSTLDDFLKKNMQKLEQMNLRASTRRETTRENFLKDRAEKRKKMIEDFDHDTPILEAEEMKRLEINLLQEFTSSNAPLPPQSPDDEHPSMKKVTQRSAPWVGDYVMFKRLGNGNSAVVYECVSRLDKKHYVSLGLFFLFAVATTCKNSIMIVSNALLKIFRPSE